jgi:hypothetical protein
MYGGWRLTEFVICGTDYVFHEASKEKPYSCDLVLRHRLTGLAFSHGCASNAEHGAGAAEQISRSVGLN